MNLVLLSTSLAAATVCNQDHHQHSHPKPALSLAVLSYFETRLSSFASTAVVVVFFFFIRPRARISWTQSKVRWPFERLLCHLPTAPANTTIITPTRQCSTFTLLVFRFFQNFNWHIITNYPCKRHRIQAFPLPIDRSVGWSIDRLISIDPFIWLQLILPPWQ